MKHISLDIKQTLNRPQPDSGYTRFVVTDNNKLVFITDTGEVNYVSNPWEESVIASNIVDPSSLTPSNWDRYIVPIGAIGAWNGRDNQIAHWYDASWVFTIPLESWILYNKDISKLVGFDGAEWVIIGVLADDITISLDTNNNLTINNIDHIIGSNNLSIDSTHVPMVDADRELVTRAYIESSGTTVDYDTVTFGAAKANTGKTNDEHEFLKETWFHTLSYTNQEGIGNNNDPLNGVFWGYPGMTGMGYIYTEPVWPTPAVNNCPIVPTGIYRLYASHDLVPYGLHMREDSRYSGWRLIYATSRYENGRWLHEINVTLTDFQLGRLQLDSPLTESYFFQLIIQGQYPGVGTDITIVGVDKIINAEGYSMDEFVTPMEDGRYELATRQYIDNTKNNVDDITIERNMDTSIPITNSNDKDLILNAAWGHGIDTGNHSWVETNRPAGASSIVNGALWLNLPVDGGGTYLEEYQDIVFTSYPGTGVPNSETWNAYVHTNVDFATNGGRISLYTTNYSLAKDEIINLSDGTFLHRYMVPKGPYKVITGMVAQIEPSTQIDQPWFAPVDISKYPPNYIIKIKEIAHIIDEDNESIDGSNTPMSDPNHELVTRAFVNGLAQGTPQTDTFIITPADISTGYLVLTQIMDPSMHETIIWNGMVLYSGASGEYQTVLAATTWVVFTASFIAQLTPSDKIAVKYYYK